MIYKLRQKFILIAMVSVTLVLVLMGLSINVLNFVTTDRQLTYSLELIYENEGTVPQLLPPGQPGDRRHDHFTPETPFSTRYFVLRYMEDGTLLRSELQHIAAVTEDDVGTYLDIAINQGEGFGYTGGYKYYVVRSNDQRYSAIFLDCQDELRALNRFAMVSVVVVAGSVLLVFLLVLFLSKRAMMPIVKSAEKQKQFITDASHELKTPLTVISTSLKVLEMETGSSKWIDKIQGQTDKMTRLVGDMVTLSRLDEEKSPLQMSGFDVSAAAEEVVDSFREVAAEQGHAIQTKIVPGLMYCGDEHAVRQLLSILLDNAVKYADPGGEIQVSLERNKKGILLKTTNPCSQMDAAETEKLFDRFYRVDKSRSSQTGGFGIGLSIARSVAEGHGGSIRAEFLEGGSVQFSVFLR